MTTEDQERAQLTTTAANDLDCEKGCEKVRDLLIYLVGVARATEGAGVWRALFAEMLEKFPP